MARPALTARAQWLRIIATVPALVAIFFLGQAVLDRRAWRFDLTPERRYTLSPYAHQVLEHVDADVRILAFLRSQDPRNTVIEDLLGQVQGISSRIRVDRYDVNRSPALAREYGVDAYGAVVVESEGRRRVFGNPNEDVLLAALLEVTRRERRVIAWSIGHGEGALDVLERRGGYSGARQALESSHFDLRPTALFNGEIDAAVDVLAIIGPDKDFLPQELDVLDHYLQAGRALLVCLDPMRAAALTERLAKYGVVFGPDVVIEPAARLYGGEELTLKAEMDRGGHPLAAAMTTGPLFSRSRSVDVAPGARGGVLVWSGRESWAAADPDAAASGLPRYDPRRDRRGPIPLGVETLTPIQAAADAEPRVAHLIAFGNATFASNFFLDYLGNRDLLTNSISWLVRDREGIGVRTPHRTPGVQQFFMSEEDGAYTFWATAVVQPAILFVIGLTIVARRRWG